nr:DUF2304 domain-containing protein [Bacillus benzoevorans]
MVAILFAVFFLIEVVMLMKKNKLHDKHAFLWMTFAVAGIVIAGSLHGLDKLSKMVGISYMPSLIFVMAFFVILSLLIYQTSIISRQQQQLKSLIQEMAYIKKDMDDVLLEKSDDKEEKVNEH